MTIARTIAGLDYVATAIEERIHFDALCLWPRWIIGFCFECDEAIDNTLDDRRCAVVTPTGRIYCSGECANWCAFAHDDWIHGLASREVEQVSYWI